MGVTVTTSRPHGDDEERDEGYHDEQKADAPQSRRNVPLVLTILPAHQRHLPSLSDLWSAHTESWPK